MRRLISEQRGSVAFGVIHLSLMLLVLALMAFGTAAIHLQLAYRNLQRGTLVAARTAVRSIETGEWGQNQQLRLLSAQAVFQQTLASNLDVAGDLTPDGDHPFFVGQLTYTYTEQPPNRITVAVTAPVRFAWLDYTLTAEVAVEPYVGRS